MPGSFRLGQVRSYYLRYYQVSLGQARIDPVIAGYVMLGQVMSGYNN